MLNINLILLIMFKTVKPQPQGTVAKIVRYVPIQK